MIIQKKKNLLNLKILIYYKINNLNMMVSIMNNLELENV
jgi:hypothetical protein